MTRKEMYEAIKAYGLQSKLSRNYTQCSNDELEKVIVANTRKAASEMKTKATNVTISGTPSAPIVTKTPIATSNDAKEIDNPYEAAILALLTVLDNAGKLDKFLRWLNER